MEENNNKNRCNMKKWTMISLVCLLMACLPAKSANVTNDPNCLQFGDIWMEGGLQAQLPQCLHIMVTNTGTADYADYAWEFHDDITGNIILYTGDIDYEYYNLSSMLIEIPAGQTKEVTYLMEFKVAGHYAFSVRHRMNYQQKLFSYMVDITDYQQPRLSGELHIDMLEQVEDENYVYGDFKKFRLTGTASLTNHESYTLFPEYIKPKTPYVAVVHVKPTSSDSSQDLGRRDITQELKGGETVTIPFEIDFTSSIDEINACYANGGRYSVGIETPWTIDSDHSGLPFITFQPKDCMLTYWTAGKKVKPLTVGSDQTIKVPQEATSVDLRGVYATNTIYTIDPSEANPNCLYFMNGLDYVRGLEGVNWVRDYEATNLTISENYPFASPMPFKAKSAHMVVTPRHVANLTFSDGKPHYSETLVLPFEAQHLSLIDINGGEEVDLPNDDIMLLGLVGYEEDPGIVEFNYFPDVFPKAYEPCLLLYLNSSRMLFYGEQLDIPSTRLALSEADGIRYMGSTTGMDTPVESCFLWDYDVWCWSRSLLPSSMWLPPFRCCMDAVPMDTESTELSVITKIMASWPHDEEPGATSVAAPVMPDGSADVYTLSGQRVATVNILGGHADLSALKPGIYIIGGKKVLKN